MIRRAVVNTCLFLAGVCALGAYFATVAACWVAGGKK